MPAKYTFYPNGIRAGYYAMGSVGDPIASPNIYVQVSNPTLAASNNIATSQSVSSTTFNINGALASGGIATLDVERNVVAAWTGTAILTFTGTDQYGMAMTEVSASGTSHTGTKAFKTITSVSSNASITGATIGTGSKIGLYYRVDTGGLLSTRFNDASDAGTFVAAVTTDPATSSTGDVRGTYTAAGTLDGAKKLVITYVISDPTTIVGTYGVTQA